MVASVSAEGGVVDQNGNPVTGTASAEAKFPLPVPLLGMQLDWAITKHSAIQTYTRAMGIDLHNIRGSQIDSAVRYMWYLRPHAGLAFGYEKIALNLPKYETDTYTARFGYTIQGLSLYLRGAF